MYVAVSCFPSWDLQGVQRLCRRVSDRKKWLVLMLSQKWCALQDVFRGLLGELLVFAERAVSRPQLSFSLEDRGARPEFIV